MVVSVARLAPAGPAPRAAAAPLPAAEHRCAGRLVLVSNRLPVTVAGPAEDEHLEPSAGGLSSALGPLHAAGDGLWVGWPGMSNGSSPSRRGLASALRRRRLAAVALAPEVAAASYNGFCNSTLWPLFHYFVHLAVFDRRWWDAYVAVNRSFARAVARTLRPGDRVWVHDYHLMLLPELLRRHAPELRIGFFLHTPFPSAELFRVLPWRRELMQGVLGADLVGFHTYDYLRHFRVAAIQVLGAEGDADRIDATGRSVRLGAFPVGVDAARYAAGPDADAQTRAELERLARELAGRRLLVGVDRMDYTKGIPERLLGFERFLELHPEHHGRIELIQLGVPTRKGAEHYDALRQRVEEIVGRVNGRFGSPEWTPLKYLYRPVAFPRLYALYRRAAVALVTPLRDGMNLVAKEFIASKQGDGDGVLVLSEFAGAAAELTEALLVNPFDPDGIAAAIHRALIMPAAERRQRLDALIERVCRREAAAWGNDFIRALDETRAGGGRRLPGLAAPALDELAAAWRAAGRRTLLLDYDGTLQPIAARPELARPDRALLALLRRLGASERVEVAIVSGRDRDTLDAWLGVLPVTLVAEHGRWLRRDGQGWEDLLGSRPPEWLDRVRETIEAIAAATPGSLVEAKSASVAWHYRGVDPELAGLRVRELVERLRGFHEDPPLDVVHGRKVIEVRVFGVGKANAVVHLLAQLPATGFVLAAGDDETDEEMFARLPAAAWSVHVGPGDSRARFALADPAALRSLLGRLARNGAGGRP